MPPQKDKDRNVILARLKERAGLSTAEVDLIRASIVATDYFSLPDHSGGAFTPTAKYFRQNGKEHTFQDVPLSKIVRAVESYIKREVSADIRTEVYHKVLAGTPGHKKVPEWEKPPPNPNEKPTTAFSKPRHVTSNQDLLEAFASAADFTPETASFIGLQITWWDGLANGQASCMMTPASRKISGGRLGRDHTLEDVPIHYFRDCLMDYIEAELKEDKQPAARKAICPDLTDAQVKEYTALIAQQREEREKREVKRFFKRRQLPSGLHRDKNEAEARNIKLVDDALESVRTEVDLAPCKRFPRIRRNPDLPKPITLSVVRPESTPMPEELETEYQFDVDQDCDQVRAMIKIFVTDGEWTIDQFRRALERVSRQQLASFLQRTGNEGQNRLAAYLLSWEFFNRRRHLGLPVSGARISDDVAAVERRDWQRQREQKRDQGRGRKRVRPGLQDEPVESKGKRQRKSKRAPLREIVNDAE